MTEKLTLFKDKVESVATKYGVKACVGLSSISGSVMAMTMSASADDGGSSTDITSTATTVLSVMTQGFDWIQKQPILSFCFVGGILGTVIFCNIKKAKRAVK